MPRAMQPIVVVGGGHAGIEAASAAARMGADVVIVTGLVATIGQTPCNPSVGGIAKGHLVAEVTAMGGFMGRAADATALQGRVLNRSKGPAVRATRLQVDKQRYGEFARAFVTAHPRIRVVEGLVSGLVIGPAGQGRPRAGGVRLTDGRSIDASGVVITTGTFLGGLMHTGATQTPGGRAGEPPAAALSAALAQMGFSLTRLKTGTPPRLRAASIDVAALEPQHSDEPFPRFLAPDDPAAPPGLRRVPCYLTYAGPEACAIARAHLHRSPMYSGTIVGRGPRYCPSFEDKVVRFADRERHQVFLEPEGLELDTVYPNGISTSLPIEVQAALVAAIPGLARAEIVRPGYAVEYDAVDARDLDHGLGARAIDGLWFAGQVNGTSGYEEAAAQGLVAGANAAAAVLGRPPLRLARDRAYAGVMVDDLVTRGCDEPYRMFTSRAEFRLNLREDNADERLAQLARDVGLLDEPGFARAQRRIAAIHALEHRLMRGDACADAPSWLVERAQARRTYAGYQSRQQREAERARGETSDLPIDADLDWFTLPGLSREMAERLARARPTSTAQAARLAGMTPASVITVWAWARARQRRGATDPGGFVDPSAPGRAASPPEPAVACDDSRSA